MRDRKTRSPYVSGIFYPSDRIELLKLLDYCFKESIFGPKYKTNKIGKKIYGLVVPHAAYRFSGAIAATAYNEIRSKDIDIFILIGPDHNGIGKKISIATEGDWQTPLGNVEINRDLATEIKNSCDDISVDWSAHQFEHSLEIQIPLIQYIRNKYFTIVPILVADQNMETAIKLGRSIAQKMTDQKTIIIASSDFTHYESNTDAHEKDKELIKTIQSLNIDTFYKTISYSNISICGYGAVAAVMETVRLLGSSKGHLLRYATSGDIQSDDKNTVVGYSSIVFV